MFQQSSIVATDDTLLSLSTWGDAPPGIVMLHGFADGRYLWAPFATSLMGHAGVLAADLRGHGDSQWDPHGAYAVATFVADAQAIVDRTCSNELVLIGHSLGAEIALRLAAANAARVRALVLVDGGPGLISEGREHMRSNFRSRVRDFGSRRAYAQTLREWMPLADDEMLDLAARHAIADHGHGYRLKSDPRLADMTLQGDDGELWSILESLRCKILLVRGEASAFLSRRAAADMERRIENLRCETVAMAGHAVMMDNPAQFGSILQRFAAEIYAGADTRRHCVATETV